MEKKYLAYNIVFWHDFGLIYSEYLQFIFELNCIFITNHRLRIYCNKSNFFFKTVEKSFSQNVFFQNCFVKNIHTYSRLAPANASNLKYIIISEPQYHLLLRKSLSLKRNAISEERNRKPFYKHLFSLINLSNLGLSHSAISAISRLTFLLCTSLLCSSAFCKKLLIHFQRQKR